MENIIESVVECGSAYGMVCVLASFILLRHHSICVALHI